MSSTHDVKCFKCKTNIAWWSQFDNIQHKDEYSCCGIIRKRNNELFMNVTNYEKQKDELTKMIKEKKLGWTRWTYCSVHNETYFCEKCAKKLKNKCSVCGGKIKLKRKS